MCVRPVEACSVDSWSLNYAIFIALGDNTVFLRELVSNKKNFLPYRGLLLVMLSFC